MPPAGDRSKLKVLANQEPNVDCLDTAGHTPLMYAVMGKQTKGYVLPMNRDIPTESIAVIQSIRNLKAGDYML